MNEEKEDLLKEKKTFEEKVQEETELKIQSIQMENKAQNEGMSK